MHGDTGGTSSAQAQGRSRLTKESVPASLGAARDYTFDFGQAGGLGVRTSATTADASYKDTTSGSGSSGADDFQRPIAERVTDSALGLSNTLLTTAYDGRGNVLTRQYGEAASQTTQDFTWDAHGRLVAVTKPGYQWAAWYDAYNRRIRTTYTPTSGTALTLDSTYDPNVEFLEIAVAAREGATLVSEGASTVRVWKVYGPDATGSFGGAQGIGALEAMVDQTSRKAIGIANDLFGNVAAHTTLNSTAMVAAELREGSYGPLPGQTPATLQASELLTGLSKIQSWQGRRPDPTGYYYCGARYYDALVGRFLSSDPMGHASSMSLYDLANGDPANRLDPDGRCADKNPFAGVSRLTAMQRAFDQNVKSITDSVQYPWQVYDDGPGYSPDRYNFITHNGDLADDWDRSFFDQVSHGTKHYPFGALPLWQVETAIERGYVSPGDRPLIAWENGSGKGTFVGMTQSDGIILAASLAAGALEGPIITLVTSAVRADIATAGVVVAEGIPQGLSTAQFGRVSAMMRSGAGHIGEDMVVQGSRAAGTATTTSDIDLAVRVSTDRFNQIISQRFGSAKLGTAKGRTMLRALDTGKIQAGEAGLSGVRRAIQGELGIETDLSIIEIGGAFDNGVTIPIW
jgi:RHS repeat-associated protein